MQNLSPEEWADWKLNPVTKAVMAWCLRQREERKEGWAAGEFTRELSDGTAQASARLIGECMAYRDITTLELSQINQGSNNE